MEEKTLLDILIYLFETYADRESVIDTNPKLIEQDMMEEGFDQKDIHTVLHWFSDLRAESLQVISRDNKMTPRVIRVYTPEEREVINVAARNYLLYLEHMGVIDVLLREHIIERALEMDVESVGIAEIKWIVFTVLFKEPRERKIDQQLLSILILGGDETVKH